MAVARHAAVVAALARVVTEFGLAAALALLVLLGAFVRLRDARHQELLQGALERALGSRGQAALDEVVLIVRENKHVLAGYHDQALLLDRQGRAEQAVAWMLRGSQAIEELAPSFLAALRTLSILTRQLSAIVPSEPIKAYAFHTWHLRGLFGVGAIVHHVLLTGKERMLLRLRLIAIGFRWAVLGLHRAAGRLRAHPEEWRRIEALAADIHTTGDETVETARRIVHTLDALEQLRQEQGRQVTR